MIKLADTKHRYSTDPKALQQYQDLFGDVSKYVAEFDPFWDEMLPQAIKQHAITGVGEYAGSGCVDYNEAKALYIFTRTIRPKVVIELGYAGGISTSFIARGLEMNGAGIVHTVDLSAQYWDVCEMFRNYRRQEIVIQHHTTDAVDFLKATNVNTILTFSDATHELEPTTQIATILKQKWPHAIHLYHEWGLSNKATPEEQSYVSMPGHIGTQFERDAFEQVFGAEYRHGGLFGSCGLGIVMPL